MITISYGDADVDDDGDDDDHHHHGHGHGHGDNDDILTHWGSCYNSWVLVSSLQRHLFPWADDDDDNDDDTDDDISDGDANDEKAKSIVIMMQCHLPLSLSS